MDMARSVVTGMSMRAVHRLSRPNSVRNHGAPAATNSSSAPPGPGAASRSSRRSSRLRRTTGSIRRSALTTSTSGPVAVAARRGHGGIAGVQGQEQVVGDLLPGGHDDVPRRQHVVTVLAGACARDAQGGAEVPVGPGEDAAAHAVGRHGREGGPGLHAVHRCEVRGQPQPERARDRLRGRAREDVALAHQAGLDVSSSHEADRRVGAGVAEVARHGHEGAGVAAYAVARHRRRLRSVDLDPQHGEDAAIAVVDARQPARVHLPVRGGPHLGGRGERGSEVVQPWLLRPLRHCVLRHRRALRSGREVWGFPTSVTCVTV